AELRHRTAALRPAFRAPLQPMPSEMFEHMDYGAHVADSIEIQFTGDDLAARHFRHEFIDLLHDPAGTEKPRTRAHDGYLREALRGRPAVDVHEKVARLGRMALHFEAVREMVDNAIGYVDLQRRQAVGGGNSEHHRFQKFPRQR